MEEKVKKRSKLMSMIAPEETPEQAVLREACEAFAARACNRIRQEMEQEKALNHVHYDLTRIGNSSEQQKTNPHYRVRWNVELDINFKKSEKYYEFDSESNVMVMRFGFAIPAFYVMEEMEKILAKDQIYPVKTRAKRVGLFRKATGEMETARVKLNRPEICNGLEAASRDYEAGFTNPHMDFETGSDFAYFLTEENNEERK